MKALGKLGRVKEVGPEQEKNKLWFGFWNVQTMFEAGKLSQITGEVRRFNLNILGISEARWTDSGLSLTNSGETVLYLGRGDDKHHEGVAIIIQKGTIE